MCGPVLDDVQKVLDEVKTLSKYNPEFAMEFLEKILHRVIDTRAELAPMQKELGT